MTPREFFNAWQGWRESETDRLEVQMNTMRDLLFSSARWHASSVAMSEEQAKAIARYRFEWEKQESSAETVADQFKALCNKYR